MDNLLLSYVVEMEPFHIDFRSFTGVDGDSNRRLSLAAGDGGMPGLQRMISTSSRYEVKSLF